MDWLLGLIGPALAFADGNMTGTSSGFAVLAPDFDFVVMGEIAGALIAIAASLTVYRKVKQMATDGAWENSEWSD